MGSILFDYLNDRLLLDESLVEQRFASVPDDELEKEIASYREFCLGRIEQLGGEIRGAEGGLRLYGGSAFRNESRLRQAALYLDTVVLPDPFFELSHVPSEASRHMGKFLNFPQREGLDRDALVDAAKFLLRMRPLAAANYVKFLPASFYSEPPIQLPIRGPEATFRKSLPEDVRRVYAEGVVVRTLVRTESGWRVTDALERGRGITIDFGREGHSYFYMLLETVTKVLDERTRHVQFMSTLPDTPPDEAQFQLWIDQSVDRAVQADLTHLGTEVAIASACDSMYVTDSVFSAKVLEARTDSPRDVTSDVATMVLNLELPILEGVTLDDIMRIRANDGEAFAAFRREVDKQFSALRLEPNPAQLRLRRENVIHELTVGQIADARQKILNLQRRLFVDAAVGVAGLAGTLFTSGLSLGATFLAVASGAKNFAEYRASKKESPGYFLWRVTNKKN